MEQTCWCVNLKRFVITDCLLLLPNVSVDLKINLFLVEFLSIRSRDRKITGILVRV
jgi:hypothetical protein